MIWKVTATFIKEWRLQINDFENMCTEKVFVIYSIYKFITEILDNVAVNFYNFASQYLAWIKKSNIERWESTAKTDTAQYVKKSLFPQYSQNSSNLHP